MPSQIHTLFVTAVRMYNLLSFFQKRNASNVKPLITGRKEEEKRDWKRFLCQESPTWLGNFTATAALHQRQCFRVQHHQDSLLLATMLHHQPHFRSTLTIYLSIIILQPQHPLLIP